MGGRSPDCLVTAADQATWVNLMPTFATGCATLFGCAATKRDENRREDVEGTGSERVGDQHLKEIFMLEA